jgi:O-methyltransferase involved in polyketide biosynthesis
MPIEHISDAARWVAVYRAMETERRDAICRDPDARRLAGARGEAIVREMRKGRAGARAIVRSTRPARVTGSRRLARPVGNRTVMRLLPQWD